MSNKNTIRICVEEDGIVYKVTSIHLLKDGSFKGDVPYCNFEEKGVIIKIPVQYENITRMLVNILRIKSKSR